VPLEAQLVWVEHVLEVDPEGQLACVDFGQQEVVTEELQALVLAQLLFRGAEQGPAWFLAALTDELLQTLVG